MQLKGCINRCKLSRMSITIPNHIFREYDVRGLVDSELTPSFANLLGRAFARLAKKHNANEIAVGYDARLSSPSYAEQIAKGLSQEGLNSWLIGMGPTPMAYFAVFTDGLIPNKRLGACIQVTGSHNPSDMNGFKMCLGEHTLSGADIQELKQLMIEINSTGAAPAATHGSINELPLLEKYKQMLVSNCKPFVGKRKLKIVCDAGNGVGGLVGPQALRELGYEVVELFCEPDGRFPNHHPDPTVLENIQTLIAKVRSEKADFGIGWDGDADRIAVVDENGEVIFGDMLTLLYAREILKTVPGATIIGDVKCSSIFFNDLKARGANVIMWKTGHSLIKAKLAELKGSLAGEMSGHICFRERFYGVDDAIYCTLRFAEIVSNSEVPVSKLLADIPKTYATPEIREDCPEELKFKIATEAQKAFGKYKVNTIDGVRIDFPEGWALVRASNTQPILVLRFEAETPNKLSEYEQLVRGEISKIQQRLTADLTN